MPSVFEPAWPMPCATTHSRPWPARPPPALCPGGGGPPAAARAGPAAPAGGGGAAAPGKVSPPIQFSSAWQRDVVSGERASRGVPATASTSAPATLVWPHEVAGNLQLT